MAARGESGSLLDAIKAAAQARHGATCTTGMLLERLAVQDRNDLDAAIADRTIPATVIAKVLTAAGHRVSVDALQRHRRGACACGRTG